jgi:hypothetical protein
MSDLKIILMIIGCVGSNEQSVGCVFLSLLTELVRKWFQARGKGLYFLTSGNHCVVKVGHSSAVLFRLSISSMQIRLREPTLKSCHREKGYFSSMSCTLNDRQWMDVETV